MKHYCCGFAFNTTGQVLLVLKAKPEWQKGRYNGVGGKLEGLELPSQAMVREFKEKTGIETREEDWTRFCRFLGPGYCVDFFKSFNYPPNQTIVCEPDEQCRWITYHNMAATTLYNLRWLIPLCFDGNIKLPVVVEDINTASA